MRSVEVFRYVIFTATICWGSWVQLAPAAEALETPKLSEAAKSGWLSFGLVSGRISLTGSRFGSINSTSSNNGRTERLTIRVTPTGPAVKYAMTGSKGEFSLEVFSGDQLSIAWKPVGEAAVPVRLQQRAGEPIGLTIGPEKQEETYRASSLWHLLIAKPAVCREHLLPLRAHDPFAPFCGSSPTKANRGTCRPSPSFKVAIAGLPGSRARTTKLNTVVPA